MYDMHWCTWCSIGACHCIGMVNEANAGPGG